MSLKIYSSQTHAKAEFHPVTPGKVKMYVCGPTVYDNIHIGNARTFISFDVIRRWLIASGYEVTFAQNLTDVDDKIINRANEQGRTAEEVATEFSGRRVDDLMVGARIEENEIKRDPLDFALWKAAKPGEPSWPSPWGEGRPGWHTECAAMVHRYLGTPIDIHGGGSDLAFPHHENECAQAECAWHAGFANIWMHTGMLLVDGEKMSKSLGNFFTLAEVLEKHSAAALRLLMLQTHYRSPLDFSWERLEGAENSLARIAGTVENLRWAAGHAAGDVDADLDAATELRGAVDADAAEFAAQMDDDFNTAGALAAVFDAVTRANQYLEATQAAGTVDAEVAHAVADTLAGWLGTLGIELPAPAEELPVGLLGVAAGLVGYTGDDVDEAAEKILEARASARAAKDWGRADAIRDQLKDMGLAIEDTPAGARLKQA